MMVSKQIRSPTKHEHGTEQAVLFVLHQIIKKMAALNVALRLLFNHRSLRNTAFKWLYKVEGIIVFIDRISIGYYYGNSRLTRVESVFTLSVGMLIWKSEFYVIHMVW